MSSCEQRLRRQGAGVAEGCCFDLRYCEVDSIFVGPESAGTGGPPTAVAKLLKNWSAIFFDAPATRR
jgi:hypothetical protein